MVCASMIVGREWHVAAVVMVDSDDTGTRCSGVAVVMKVVGGGRRLHGFGFVLVESEGVRWMNFFRLSYFFTHREQREQPTSVLHLSVH